MATEAKEKEILAKLKECVVEFDEDGVVEAANEALAEGIDAEKAVFDGLVEGMVEVGRLYEEQEYFVPEMLMCADALYAGLDVLKPHMGKEGQQKKGAVVMGVVQGDVHDIGKNIVKMMFDSAGFDVYDLGRDVPLDQFVEEQLKTDSELVCLSAMMTTTMVEMCIRDRRILCVCVPMRRMRHWLKLFAALWRQVEPIKIPSAEVPFGLPFSW